MDGSIDAFGFMQAQSAWLRAVSLPTAYVHPTKLESRCSAAARAALQRCGAGVQVRVSRKRIMESASKVMELYGAGRALLELEFFNEVGTGLGPTLEFYTLLAHELQRKSLNMWRCEDCAPHIASCAAAVPIKAEQGAARIRGKSDAAHPKVLLMQVLSPPLPPPRARALTVQPLSAVLHRQSQIWIAESTIKIFKHHDATLLQLSSNCHSFHWSMHRLTVVRSIMIEGCRSRLNPMWLRHGKLHVPGPNVHPVGLRALFQS